MNTGFSTQNIQSRREKIQETALQTDIENYVNDNTKLIWVETPTNPMMNVIDIKATAQVAKRHDILLAVDNTFATPYLQRPLDLGADIVMHSATKFLNGHSDIVGRGRVFGRWRQRNVKQRQLARPIDSRHLSTVGEGIAGFDDP